MKGILGHPIKSEDYNPSYVIAHLSTAEDWQKYYSETLKVPEELTKGTFWSSLTVEEYKKIYKKANQRMNNHSYSWEQLDLVDAVLLLGDINQLQVITGQPTNVILDHAFLNKAAQLSTLPMIKFLIEDKELPPANDRVFGMLPRVFQPKKPPILWR